jgi:hypothetical protein
MHRLGAYRRRAQAEPGGLPLERSPIGLYRKVGFIEEGRLRKHYRRQSGELWDVIVMGLLLE